MKDENMDDKIDYIDRGLKTVILGECDGKKVSLKTMCIVKSSAQIRLPS